MPRRKKENLLKGLILLILLINLLSHKLLLNHLKTSEVPNNNKSMDMPDLFKESLQELFENALYSPILAVSEVLKGAKERKQYEKKPRKKIFSILSIDGHLKV